ncbi:hypothetical protein LTR72_006514 [Exophiala xenobiotica]|nr:hypothetical protein LTR72_006514 [Exophiala xenobiotica]KAK5295292.1 hypothetical protein LTR14_004462 [Exophiala xenobiotica]KAK5327264.1 hypothetical protein LTR93_002648 [Exophiala xenobiotica]KAK5414277.1 hypothetical protein LTR06_004090 [Exophiala xenobiotica]KAK5474393.1 hypothetical protein LTR55_009890 [Exophiala xenobiotica]
MAESKVAIVTGAAGGIGVNMSKVLLSKGYHVVLADINAETGDKAQKALGSNTLFIQVDLADWAAHAAMFKKAFEWRGRLDVLVANAGIVEKEKFYAEPDTEHEPEAPNLKVVDVDLSAVICGLKLFRHYWRKSGNPGLGKVIITSSMAGIYAFIVAPLYSAAKHGIVGLVRASSHKLRKTESITINTICPGPVDTGISEQMKKVVPEERFTPMSVVLGAFEKFLDEDITGQVAEASNKQFYLRLPVEYADENSEFLVEDMKRFA